MITFDDPRERVPAAALERRGGFAWWYAELLDESASGIVLIWSYGLPFLPGYASLARAGRGQRPAERPSLNVVTYERGVASAYSLHEFRPESVRWDRLDGGGQRWLFGASRITLSEHGQRRRLAVDLSCPTHPGSPGVRGHVHIEGVVPERIEASLGLDADNDHLWTPLALPARGRAQVQLDDGSGLSVAGPAYLDRNHGRRGLHDLGIATWLWGHASIGGGERVFYALWPESRPDGPPECVALEVSADGGTRLLSDVAIALHHPTTTAWGMPSWRGLTLRRADGSHWLDVGLSHRVDHGPFYLRWLTETRADGERSIGSAEAIVPARVDLARHRPLVRMRVGSERRRNSTWLPLFSGARHTRLQRLFTSWTGAPR